MTRPKPIIGGSCHKHHFCRDKGFLSQETRVCRDTHMFVTTKHVFCCDKIMLVATKLLSYYQFVLAIAWSKRMKALRPNKRKFKNKKQKQILSFSFFLLFIFHFSFFHFFIFFIFFRLIFSLRYFHSYCPSTTGPLLSRRQFCRECVCCFELYFKIV